MAKKQQKSAWTGWISFAVIMMSISGGFQLIQGLAALFQPDILVTTNVDTWLFDMSTWAWLHILWGAAVLIAAGSLHKRHAFGRLFAMFSSIFGIMINMVSIPFAPIWAVVSIVVYFFVLYAVVIHSDDI